jgi:hypothetical protein
MAGDKSLAFRDGTGEAFCSSIGSLAVNASSGMPAAKSDAMSWSLPFEPR